MFEPIGTGQFLARHTGGGPLSEPPSSERGLLGPGDATTSPGPSSIEMAMVTFVLLHVRSRDHVVLTGPAIRRPMKFKTREQAKDWARKHFPQGGVAKGGPLMRASMALGRQMSTHTPKPPGKNPAQKSGPVIHGGRFVGIRSKFNAGDVCPLSMPGFKPQSSGVASCALPIDRAQ